MLINDIPNNWNLVIDELLRRKKIGIPLVNPVNFKTTTDWKEKPIHNEMNETIANKNMQLQQPWIIKESSEIPDYYYFFNNDTKESRWTIPKDFITTNLIPVNDNDLKIQNMIYENTNNNNNIITNNDNNNNDNNNNDNNNDNNNNDNNNDNNNNDNHNDHTQKSLKNMSDLKDVPLIIKKV